MSEQFVPIADEVNIDKSPISDGKQSYSMTRSLSSHGGPTVVEVVPIAEQDVHEARAGLLAEHNNSEGSLSGNNTPEAVSRTGCTRRRVFIFSIVATLVAVAVILLVMLSGPRASSPPKHTTIMISLGKNLVLRGVLSRWKLGIAVLPC